MMTQLEREMKSYIRELEETLKYHAASRITRLMQHIYGDHAQVSLKRDRQRHCDVLTVCHSWSKSSCVQAAFYPYETVPEYVRCLTALYEDCLPRMIVDVPGAYYFFQDYVHAYGLLLTRFADMQKGDYSQSQWYTLLKMCLCKLNEAESRAVKQQKKGRATRRQGGKPRG